MYIEEVVYLGRDNVIALKLTSEGVAINHTSITRVQLKIGATLVDSNTTPTYFDFSQPDRLILKLGASGLTAGRQLATLIIYDATHTSGLVWGDFSLTVYPA